MSSPARSLLKGTIRSGSDATRERAWRRVREILEGMAASHGASVQLDIHKGEPGVVNDVEMAELIAASGKACIGADNVLNTPGWTIADDFGYYSEKRPSVYFRLGIRNEAVGSVYPLHHPRFRVDEAALKIGAATPGFGGDRLVSDRLTSGQSDWADQAVQGLLSI